MSGQTQIGFGRGRARAPMIRRANGAVTTAVVGSMSDSQPPTSRKPAVACVPAPGTPETHAVLEPLSAKPTVPRSTGEAAPNRPEGCTTNARTYSASSVTNTHVPVTNSSIVVISGSLESVCPMYSVTPSVDLPLANLSSQATGQTTPLTSAKKFHFYSAPVFVPPHVSTTKNEFPLTTSDKIAAVLASQDSARSAKLPESFPAVSKDSIVPPVAVQQPQCTATPQLANAEAAPSRIKAQGHMTNSTNQSKPRIAIEPVEIEVIPEEKLRSAFDCPAKSSVPPEPLSNRSKLKERESADAHYTAGSIAPLQKNLGAGAVGTPTVPKLRISNVTAEQANGDSPREDKKPKANESSIMKHGESGKATAPPPGPAGIGSGRKTINSVLANLLAVPPTFTVPTPTPTNAGKIAGVQGVQDKVRPTTFNEIFRAVCKGSVVPPATVHQPQRTATPQLANIEVAPSGIEVQGHVTISNNQSKPSCSIQRVEGEVIPAEKLRNAFDFPAKSSGPLEPLSNQSKPKERICMEGEQSLAFKLPATACASGPASVNAFVIPSVVALTTSKVSLGASFACQQSSMQNTQTPACDHDRTAQFPARMRDSLEPSRLDNQRPKNSAEHIDFQAIACSATEQLSSQDLQMQFGTSSDDAKLAVPRTFSQLTPAFRTKPSHLEISTSLSPLKKLLVEPASQFTPTAVAAQENQLPSISASKSKCAAEHEPEFRFPPLPSRNIAPTLVSHQQPSAPDIVPSNMFASSVAAKASIKVSLIGSPSLANPSDKPMQPRRRQPFDQLAAVNSEGAQKVLVEKVDVKQPAAASPILVSSRVRALLQEQCQVATRQLPSGTDSSKIVPVVGQETSTPNNATHAIDTRFRCVSGQKQVEMKRSEELRVNDKVEAPQLVACILNGMVLTSQPTTATFCASLRSFGDPAVCAAAVPPAFGGPSTAAGERLPATVAAWASPFRGPEPCAVGRFYNEMYEKHPDNACLALLMLHHVENSGHAFCTGPAYFTHLSTVANRSDIALSILRHADPSKLESILSARMSLTGVTAGGRKLPPRPPVDILTTAVQEQNLDLLKWAFERGVKPFQRNRGIISVALQAKDLNEKSIELIRLLIDAGAPIFSRHFEIAVARQNLKLLEILLANYSLSHAYHLSQYLIYSCCHDEMLAYLKLLLNLHPKCFAPFGGKNVLILGIQNNATACVDEILNVSKRKLSRKQFVKFVRHQSDSALRLAFDANNVDLAISLLTAGAGVHFFDKYDYGQQPTLLTSDTMLRIVPAIQMAGVIGESTLTRILFDMLRAVNVNLDALQQARAKSERLSTALSALQSSHDCLRAEFAIAQTKAVAASIELQDRNREIEGLQKVSADNMRLSTALSTLQSSYDCLQAECTAAQSKLASSAREIQEKSQELTEAQKERAKLLAEKASCEAKTGTLNEQNVRIRAQLREKAQKLGNLHKEANATAAEKRVLANENEKLQKAVAGLRGENANLAAQYEALVEQLAQQPGTSQQPVAAAGTSLPNCGICFNEYVEDRRQMALPCGHVYCSVCIRTLLTNLQRPVNTKPACPTCRRGFREKAVLKLIDTSAE